jgi:hypothetical protein
MALTAKQEAFAQAVASGKTQADAYRSAYDCKNSSEKTIHDEASDLMRHPEIAPRVAYLKEQLGEKALWTREMSVQALVSAYKIAKGKDNASGMTGAIKELNAMHGFNEPTKHELSGPNGGPMDIAAIQITLVKPDESKS